ncbi:hypothetical protein evm_013008 [Chilo suppressalis]|nr:hypothetical protein evm_013008 [Chilo suppressalis]
MTQHTGPELIVELFARARVLSFLRSGVLYERRAEAFLQAGKVRGGSTGAPPPAAPALVEEKRSPLQPQQQGRAQPQPEPPAPPAPKTTAVVRPKNPKFLQKSRLLQSTCEGQEATPSVRKTTDGRPCTEKNRQEIRQGLLFSPCIDLSESFRFEK